MQLTEIQMEALGILQEECAEVIQAISKIRRAGPDFCPRGGVKSNQLLLREEMTDVRILTEVCKKLECFGSQNLKLDTDYYENKKERLIEWSSIPYQIIKSI